jgi:IS30 family transposase
MNYHELSIENRVTIRISQAHSLSQQAISNLLNRSPSTVSRELRRNADTKQPRVAPLAQSQTVKRHKASRPARRLLPDSALFELVIVMLRPRCSPEQIAGKLRSIPTFEDACVCRETIYNAICALPVGELRKELIICLCQGKSSLRPRSSGVDRHGQIPDMASIHVRPP